MAFRLFPGYRHRLYLSILLPPATGGPWQGSRAEASRGGWSTRGAAEKVRWPRFPAVEHILDDLFPVDRAGDRLTDPLVLKKGILEIISDISIAEGGLGINVQKGVSFILRYWNGRTRNRSIPLVRSSISLSEVSGIIR